jgi:hypothetical protein
MASASSDILTNTPHWVTAFWDRTQIDRFDVIAIAASDWSERSKIQLDNKYLNWSIAD